MLDGPRERGRLRIFQRVSLTGHDTLGSGEVQRGMGARFPGTKLRWCAKRSLIAPRYLGVTTARAGGRPLGDASHVSPTKRVLSVEDIFAGAASAVSDVSAARTASATCSSSTMCSSSITSIHASDSSTYPVHTATTATTVCAATDARPAPGRRT